MNLRAPLCLLALLSSLVCWPYAAWSDDPQPPSVISPQDPIALLTGIDERAARIGSLRYGVVRVTERKGTRSAERWGFAMQDALHFRVDYVGDTIRQVVCDGAYLWDYQPNAGRARRVDLGALEAADREGMLRTVMEKVAVPGFRVGVTASGMSWNLTEPVQGYPIDAVHIMGTNVAGDSILYVLGGGGSFILHNEIREQGRFVVAVDASQHREVAPGIWFPGRVEIVAPDEGGEVRVRMDIMRVVAGEVLSDMLFQMSLDPSIRIESVP